MTGADTEIIRISLREMNAQIKRAQDGIGMTRWSKLTCPQRRKLVDAMLADTLSDKELFTEYRRITKEETVNAVI